MHRDEEPTVDLPSGRSRQPALRIGDAERELAARSLGDHYTAGRLDRSELDERLGAAYRAKTAAELARLFADLPQAAASAARPRAAAVRHRRPGPPVWAVPILLVLLSVLAHGLLAAEHGGRGHGGPPLFLFVLVWFLIAGRRRAWR